MTNYGCFLKKRIPTALAALAVAGALHAASAGAVTLEFKQNSGFYSGNSTASPCTLNDICVASLLALGGTPPVAAQGGFDMFNNVPLPPTAASPDGSGGSRAFMQAAWGCNSFSDPVINCANAANGSTPNWTSPNGWDLDPYAFALLLPANPVPNRSSLEVQGQFGDGTAGHPFLNDVEYETITKVIHHNRDIDGNVLSTINVVSWLQLGTPLSLPEGPDATVVHVTFTETDNHPAAGLPGCTVVPPANFAFFPPPANPLGSQCDDFAIIPRGDLIPQDVPLPGMKLSFRLFVPAGQTGALVCDGSIGQDAKCLGYDGTDIILYTGEHNDNEVDIQAILVPDTIAGGCTFTQGYWKTHSTYGPAAHPDPGWFLIGDVDGDTQSEGPDEQFFASGQTWIQTFQTNPKGGNAYYILAHQWEAAELNVANGANPSSLGTTLTQAAALLSTYSSAKTIDKKDPNRAIAINLAGILGAFNTGTLPGGPQHCAEVNPDTGLD